MMISLNYTAELTCSDSFAEIVRFYEIKRSQSFFLKFDITMMILR